MNSRIEWTDETWNPTKGCTRVSKGCDNCYAAEFTHRLGKMAEADRAKGRDPGRKAQYEGLTVLNPRGDRHFNGVVRCNEDALSIPMGWKKPRRVFVDSMSDLFHPEVPFEFIDRVFAVMACLERHTFQILTKRPDRMAEYLDRCRAGEYFQWDDAGKPLGCHLIIDNIWTCEFPLPNVMLGTSVENQSAADERIPWLLQCPAAVRFLSCEPLLGPVDLLSGMHGDRAMGMGCDPAHMDNGFDGLVPMWTPGIHQVIVGGESGAKARPMHPDWARDLRDQCQAAGVAFFFKQWGEWMSENEFELSIDPSRDSLYDRTGGNPRYQSICVRRSDGATSHDAEALNCTDLSESDAHGNDEQRDPAIMYRVGKKAAGRLLDGREWNDMPSPAETKNH